jgi:hypothetical protein
MYFQFGLIAHPLSEFSEKKIIESFDNFKSEDLDIKIHGNTDEFPEVKVTNLYTSPYYVSSQSLLFRIPTEARFESIEARFLNPYYISGIPLELEFHLYSNLKGGDLYLLVEDVFHKPFNILITRVNFVGWKKINTSTIFHLPHSDIVLKEDKKIKILGLIFIPPQNSERNRELILVLDNIIVYTLDKYKLLLK